METSNCFQRLIEHTKKTEMPSAFRLEVVKALEYFKTQALCDLDRRDPPLTLRSHWQTFKGQVRGLNLLESYKPSEEHFWRIVHAFVYEAEPCSLIVPPPPAPPPRLSEYTRWTEEDLFKHLGKEVEAIPQFQECERDMIVYGLLYLASQSRLPNPARDPGRCAMVWRAIQPRLDKLGLMMRFKKEEHVKARLKKFLGLEG